MLRIRARNLAWGALRENLQGVMVGVLPPHAASAFCRPRRSASMFRPGKGLPRVEM